MTAAAPEVRLIPIAQLEAHSANPNVLVGELRAKLTEHLRATRRYPFVIVRPYKGHFQIIDGHQRVQILGELGETEIWCVIWDLTDHETLIAMATINTVHGEEIPARRADLLRTLAKHESIAALARLLPESEAELSAAIAFPAFDLDTFVVDLETRTQRQRITAPRVFTFAVDPDDATTVEEALSLATSRLAGRNRTGRALVMLACAYITSAGDRS